MLVLVSVSVIVIVLVMVMCDNIGAHGFVRFRIRSVIQPEVQLPQ